MTETERPDPAALRRLLAAVPARDLPLSIYPDALEWEKEIIAADGDPVADVYDRDNEPAVDRAELIVAAVNALGPLLDRLEAAEAALADDAVERLSAAVHEGWMAHQRATGYQSSRSKADGEEFMVPYADLSEGAKEIDRATVRAVLAAQRAALAGAGEGERP